MRGDSVRHANHRHRLYLLSCPNFDLLRERAKSMCEICGPAGWTTRTPAGSMFIDHDHGLGIWAVRGLLCGKCNALVDQNREFRSRQAVRAYLANPFHKTLALLARAGVEEGASGA